MKKSCNDQNLEKKTLSDRSLTIAAINDIDDYDIDEEPEKLVGYITRMADDKLFSEGIKEICIKHGYADSNCKTYKKFIIDNVKEKNIITDSKELKSFDQSVSNWLKKDYVKNDSPESRNNVYKMCFALSMSRDEIVEFFLKKYLYRPFNHRSLWETVLDYAVSNSKDYLYAVRLFEKIKTTELSEKDNKDILYTKNFDGDKAANFTVDEKKFIRHCKLNYAYFEDNNATAIKNIVDLLITLLKEMGDNNYFPEESNKASKSIQDKLRELSIRYLDGDFIGDDKIGEVVQLLRDIYGEEFYDAFSNDSKNLKVPYKLKRRLPYAQLISDTISGKDVGSDVYRKILILLDFYDFFTLEPDYTETRSEDFIEEINTLLHDCGYLKLYARNPYDWMFMYCAKQEDPHDALRNILITYLNSK